jgi:GNAT superfamily N-acetyltransferase
MDLRFRVMTPADIPAGMRLKDIARWNQTRGDWERFLAADPEGCFVAENNGSVVGTAATISYQGRLAWIGMVLVDPAWRNQGIGKRLLAMALEYLDGCRISSIKLDATPQGKILYGKLGFATEYELDRWQLLSPQPAIRAVEPHPLADEVLNRDREVFGADRSALLQSVAREHGRLAIECRAKGRLTGYAYGRHGALADHLGPWVAEDETSARHLLEEFLLRSCQAKVFVDAVRENPWAPPLLREKGFQPARPLTRMYRGRNDFPGRPDLQGAILGPEFG